MYEVPVHDPTDSPYISSIVRQCKWPSLSGNIVEIQKFCYHGNMTSHLFISPFQLFIRVVQNRLAGEQETHCK